ncbi:helix-turn-helix domain-containing protein [Aquabacterium humicola]|uniref:helix-turn-helix domain-containing protein n=1 Tax=Aquabacterium humicola TaxID=3237377 RepID=UPI002543C3FB|nr:helix-turn-helix domain-containing protein [Rubrivivax pictus]
MDYPVKTTAQLRPQLQALRKKRGLTQAQLGQALGVTQARIVEIEAAPASVSLQQIMQVLSVLGAGLVIRDDEPPAPGPAPSVRGSRRATGGKRGSW